MPALLAHRSGRSAAVRGALVGVVALVALVPAASASASSPPLPAAASGPSASTYMRTTEVTLITGDRVLVEPAGPGGPPYELQRAPRPDGAVPGFTITHDDGDLYVVPDDVADLVPAVLDRELFNVSALVDMRYDDRSTDTLPLLLEYAEGVRPQTLPAGLTVGVALPSIDGSAASVVRRDRAALGASLITAAPASAIIGISHVWLDRRISTATAPSVTPDARLDENLRQIGAPAAWATGLSGKGVTVAVLASGVDASHPDLQGQVAAAKNFSDAPSTDDVLGVGTLVGSLVAGTGAAADGARKGVAFGATLLSAKVIDDYGFGTVSSAIAGMEWAVANGADVVDLAIAAQPTDGRDPLRSAVDRLTAEAGALFVAPAGDVFFVEPFTIASPGDAAAALTVGAVDSEDIVQGFSGQGPALDGYRAKPGLTAPGVDIVGAIPGPGGQYGSLRGTTPAAAQVAGAAALLLEHNPAWSPAQLASRLEAAAAPTADTPVLRQGAGRLDIGAAVSGEVSSGAAEVDLGVAAYPQTDPIEHTITVHNDGAPVTITLATELQTMDGSPAPDGFATTTPASVTIPRGGSSTVTLTVRPVDGVAPGAYSGLLTGSTSQGAVLRLPVGLYWEPERYDLTVQVLDDTGEPNARGAVEIYGKESFTDAFFPHERLDAKGATTVRVPPGFFSATGHVRSDDGSLAIVAAPEVRVTHDTTVVLDARQARPISIAVQGIRTTLTQADVYYSIGDEEGRGATYAFFPPVAKVDAGLVRATPTATGKHGSFALSSRWRLEAGSPDEDQSGTIYDLEYESAAIPDPPAYSLDPTDDSAVETIETTYDALGTPAQLPSFRAYYSQTVGIAMATFHPLEVPTRRTEIINARPDLHWYACAYLDAAALSRVCDDDRPARGGLHRRTTWLHAVHPAIYQLQRWDDVTLFTEIGVSDGEHSGPADYSVWSSTTLTLYRDGEIIGQQGGNFAYFAVAPGPATYTLEHRGTFAGTSPIQATAAVSRWRFTSDSPPPGGQFGLPAHFGFAARPTTSPLGLADPGEALRVRLHAEREGAPPSEAPLVGRRAWASGDSGATWQRIRLRPGHDGPDGFITRVPAALVPAGGAVSLRIRFVDADGGRVRSRVDDLIAVAA